MPIPPSSIFIGSVVAFSFAVTVIGLPPAQHRQRDRVAGQLTAKRVAHRRGGGRVSSPTFRTTSPSFSPASSAGESGATASITGRPSLSPTTTPRYPAATAAGGADTSFTVLAVFTVL